MFLLNIKNEWKCLFSLLSKNPGLDAKIELKIIMKMIKQD